MMGDTMEQEPEIVTDEPEAPVTGLPSSSNTEDDLDSLLREYDEKTRQSELPAADNNSPLGEVAQDAPVQDGSGELDALLQELAGPSADTQRADTLQNQVNELQAQVRREQDWREYESFANDLQRQAAELSPHIDENFVRLRLESAAHNKEIALAFDTRHINPADAARDLAYVQHALGQAQANPNAGPKQVQELQTLAYQLNIAANGPSILRRLRNSILTEAKNSKPPYDADLSADYFAVAQAVREASSGDIPEPPVRLGQLTDAEFRAYTKKNWGF